jgi:hypothetical protein
MLYLPTRVLYVDICLLNVDYHVCLSQDKLSQHSKILVYHIFQLYSLKMCEMHSTFHGHSWKEQIKNGWMGE